jgi:predicted dehydrogenase
LSLRTRLSCGFVNRYNATLACVREMVDEGRIGRLLDLRGSGKKDARGGGKDLWVLDSHSLDMMTTIGGSTLWSQATVSTGGTPITKADAVKEPEGLGLIAGDRIDARWGLWEGVPGFFASVRETGLKQSRFGLMHVGSAGAIQILFDNMPHALLRRMPIWRADRDAPW